MGGIISIPHFDLLGKLASENLGFKECFTFRFV